MDAQVTNFKWRIKAQEFSKPDESIGGNKLVEIVNFKSARNHTRIKMCNYYEKIADGQGKEEKV